MTIIYKIELDDCGFPVRRVSQISLWEATHGPRWGRCWGCRGPRFSGTLTDTGEPWHGWFGKILVRKSLLMFMYTDVYRIVLYLLKMIDLFVETWAVHYFIHPILALFMHSFFIILTIWASVAPKSLTIDMPDFVGRVRQHKSRRSLGANSSWMHPGDMRFSST